jgi:hypothetical protein
MSYLYFCVKYTIMKTLIIQTEKEKLTALKSFLEEMNIIFEVKKPKIKKEDRPYNPEFVKKILESMEDYKKGNYIELKDEYRKELFG